MPQISREEQGTERRGAPILEFVRSGRLLRVSALDPRTLIEVVAYGPASGGEAALRRLALAKLQRAVTSARNI